MVFHNCNLDRMAFEFGDVNHHSATDLSAIELMNSSRKTLPKLTDILALVGEKVTFLI